MEDDLDTLAFTSATWMEILEPIPDQWLNECFKSAAKDGKQVTPGEMVRAWSTLVHNGTVAKGTVGLPEGPQCEFCNGTSLMYRDKQGNKLTWSSRGLGETVSRCGHEEN